MFSQSPVATAGSASQARAGSKKVSRTRGQPGVEVMPTTRPTTTTTVLTTAMTRGAGGLAAAVGHPLLLERGRLPRRPRTAHDRTGAPSVPASHFASSSVQRAVRLQRVHGLGDAGGQRAVLGQHHPELVGVPEPGGSWPTIVPSSSWAAVM